MTLLSVENLSKSFGLKTLFEGITFGLSKGDKTALIARNGTGKSTLLRILAGLDGADSGRISIRNGLRIGYLDQEPQLDPRKTIAEVIATGESDIVRVVMAYEAAVERQAEDPSEAAHTAFEKALAAMEAANAWDFDLRMTQILGKLGIHKLGQMVGTLSGGERKRVALAFVLIGKPDLLILDEPTNHLDVDMIEWLEATLVKESVSLLMVTHDRYFLDRVCDHILEIHNGILYHHTGNYGDYLVAKAEREQILAVDAHKADRLLRKEMDWMRKSPRARTTKSKSRIDAFYRLHDKVGQRAVEADLKLDMKTTRLGGQVLELEAVSKAYGGKPILTRFSYSFTRGERIGIIGANGVGKSTFLKILTGEESVDSGRVLTGSTVKIGHYRQQGLDLPPDKRAIDVLKDVAEVVELSDGTRISAGQFLERFRFMADAQYTPVGKLSGGERRRLGLMMALLAHPNVLILDEPTNDLDLETLQVLEAFLEGFDGCLVIVSHDRFFMDKLVDHFFVFRGDGTVADFNGSYAEYRESLDKKADAASKPKVAAPVVATAKATSKDNRKVRELEAKIETLEAEKSLLETKIGSNELKDAALLDATNRYGAVVNELDATMEAWIEAQG
jgi:ATP-binding cassette subfamily F protein uup